MNDPGGAVISAASTSGPQAGDREQAVLGRYAVTIQVAARRRS
jgi:hypothetical protein